MHFVIGIDHALVRIVFRTALGVGDHRPHLAAIVGWLADGQHRGGRAAEDDRYRLATDPRSI